ncbi:23S rRNA (adenine(1618)-N(6))-methyltransferase RlmF [Vibrio diazotrophicus]|uniref:23S rRNA (adenine(1618)-N(6))-methyltransferase RlmF n=1 Tax=Vibrio diazotrophicus TaxID=685 RepID=UPI00142E1150|nr:23S rRNA (adenine(1618)-N(6))-methyltransferase RlmF [Vibrio diazotrophicus]NIY94224.1 23S rRNA (adenine(1618)-N(6))-methyltransferase RlmF [Vibrio diazotrophicus]
MNNRAHAGKTHGKTRSKNTVKEKAANEKKVSSKKPYSASKASKSKPLAQPKSSGNAKPTVKPNSVTKGKEGLHNRNRHKGNYDFMALCKVLPELKPHLIKNPKGDWSISFSDPIAVKLLNKALLALHYGVTFWDIPQGYLCPPIPGRADYIHRVADLLQSENSSLKQNGVRALDIGVGANCIYPIIGVTEYGWSYVGSDVDPVSVKQANNIALHNHNLKGRIECRLQSDSKSIFSGIIQPNEKYDVTTCNPPFHASLAEAEQGTQRKLKNLQANKKKKGLISQPPLSKQDEKTTLNFGGQKAELWCPGGEAAFIKNMAFESQQFGQQVLWFTTLISKSDNVRWMKKQLQKVGVESIKVVEMQQGQKISRFIAWTFQNVEQRKLWFKASC